MNIRSRLSNLLLLLAAAIVPMAESNAQSSWKPSKPVRLVVPYAAGGGTDVAARLVADKIAKSLGQPVVVENRVGANGVVAQDNVFNSPADGHALLVGTADTQAINPLVMSAVRNDPAAMAAVAPLAGMSLMMCGARGSGPKDLPEFVARAKSTSIDYAHWGIGGIGHLGMEAFKVRAGLKDMQGVPYQGSAPGVAAVMGGQVSAMLVPMPVALASTDRLNCFAVASKQRFIGAKDVPTLMEKGYDIDVDSYVGIFAPPNTPKPVLEALHKAISEVMGDPEIRNRYLELGMNPQQTPSADAYAAAIREDVARWKRMVSDSGVKFDK